MRLGRTILLGAALVAVLVSAGLATAARSGGSPASTASPSTGQALAAPHPQAILAVPAAAGPAIYSSHYWAGAYYSGTSRNVTQLATTLHVPDAVPSSKEFYYVLLSVWDTAGSYDQIGFTNDFGSWGFAYSYTSACAGTYYYNPNQATLHRGESYTFSMGLSASGNLTFRVAQGNSTVASLTRYTGGTGFLVQGTYSCSAGTYYDYTDYEEVYYSVQQMPSFDLEFQANSAGNVSVTAWSSMGSPPGGGAIHLAGPVVDIQNEGFWLAFAGTRDSVKVPSGTTGLNLSVVVHRAFAGTNVTLSASGGGSAFGFTFSRSSGAPSFSSAIDVAFVAVSPKVTYTITLEATDSGGSFTYLTLQIYER